MYQIKVVQGQEREKITCPICQSQLGKLSTFKTHFKRKHQDECGKLEVIKIEKQQQETTNQGQMEIIAETSVEEYIEPEPGSEMTFENPVFNTLLMQLNEKLLKKIRQTPDFDFDIVHAIQISMGGPENCTREQARNIFKRIKAKFNQDNIASVKSHRFKGGRGSESPVCDFKTLLKIYCSLPGKAGRKIRDECLELTTRAMAGDYDLEAALGVMRAKFSGQTQQKLLKNISSSSHAQTQRQEQQTLEAVSTSNYPVIEYSSHDLRLTVQGMYPQEQPSSMMLEMMWQKADNDIEKFISIFARILEPKYKHVAFINEEKRKESEEKRKDARLEGDLELVKKKGAADIEVVKQKGSAEVEILKSKAKTEAKQAAQLHDERIQTERKRREALVKAETSLVKSRGTKRKFKEASLIFPQNKSSKIAISPAPSQAKMQIIQNILKKSKEKLNKKEARKKRKLAQKTKRVFSVSIDVPSAS